MMSDDVNSADIFSFHVVAYHCIIVESNKSDAINSFKNAVWVKVATDYNIYEICCV